MSRPSSRPRPRTRTGVVSSTSAQRFAGRARRRRTGRLVALLALLALGAAAAALVWLVGWSDVLTVRAVDVRGAPERLARAVEGSAGVPAGIPLARVDVDGAQERVEALPDVAAADVDRSWPRTVVVEVTVRRPVARLEAGGDLPLVDADGELFGALVEDPGGLPTLAAPTGAAGTGARAAAVQVLRGLPDQLAGRVTRVRAQTPVDVRLELDDGATVVWGGLEAGERKAAVLAALLRQEGRRYDVSAPERPAVLP